MKNYSPYLTIVLAMSMTVCSVSDTVHKRNTEDEQLTGWRNYVTYILHTLVTQGCGNCRHKESHLAQFIYTLRCSKSMVIKCLTLQYTDISPLTAPYGFVLYESWKPVTKQWLISVYKSFTINITLIRAHVPFSDDCLPHCVEVYKGDKNTSDSLVQRFCGFVTMETVETRHNVGIIKIQSFTEISLFSISINAVYEIASPTSTMAHNRDISCLSSGLNVMVEANVLQYLPSSMHYVWYLVNALYYVTNTTSYSTPVMFISHVVLRVHSCRGHDDKTRIVLYPGLLPHYWTLVHVKPYNTWYCSNSTHHSTHQSEMILDFHMYATMVLNLPFHDQTTSMNITFHHNDGISTNSMDIDMVYRHADHNLLSGGLLKHGRISAYSATLMFTSFEYIGEAITGQPYVKPQLDEELFVQGQQSKNFTTISITIGESISVSVVE